MVNVTINMAYIRILWVLVPVQAGFFGLKPTFLIDGSKVRREIQQETLQDL